MRTRQKQRVATDTCRSLGCRTTPLEHWSKRKSTVERLFSGIVYSLIKSQTLNLDGRRSTTDDVATVPFHLSLSSAALGESPNAIPVLSLMLSSHPFFCLSLLLDHYFTVSCRIVFAMPEDLEMSPKASHLKGLDPSFEHAHLIHLASYL